MPRKVFTAGEILTAANLNDVSDATVMVFDDATARATAIPTPVAGMVTYLVDTDSVEKFDGTNFVPVIEAEPPTISQVVQTAKTDVFSTASTTFQTVTGLTATITPSSSSSKVLVIVQVVFGGYLDSNSNSHYKMTRGGTDVYVGDASNDNVRAVFGGFTDANTRSMAFSASIVFLDSPETTSSTTYQVEVRAGTAGTLFINRATNPLTNATASRGASSITVMEVAG